ncbi:MFS transporter [Pigmentiphaga litoralis]|uniref:MFS transporter n=1 Tax=Pigmentiphaga litoralis TaxID=516702 RepID=UPI003B439869
MPSTVRTRAFVALAIASALLGSSVPSPLYPHYQEIWQLSSSFVSAVFATYAIGVLVSLTLLGRIADRIRDRRVIVLSGLGVIGLGSVIFAFADTPAWLLVGRLFAGAGTGAMVGAANAALVELDPRGDQQRAAVIGTMAFTAGGALGPVLSGLALQWNLWPTVLPFLAILLTAVCAFVGIVASPWVHRPFVPAGQRHDAPAVSARTLYRSLGFPFLIAMAALMMSWSVGSVFMAASSTIATHLVGIVNPALTGLLVFLFQAMGSVSQLAFRTVRFQTSITWGVLVVALAQASFFVSAWTHSAVAFLVATAFAGLGYGAAFVGAAGLTNYIAPSASRVTVVSWFYVAGYVGGNALPALAVGVLADAFGLFAAVGIFSAVVMGGGIYTLLRNRHLQVAPTPAR